MHEFLKHSSQTLGLNLNDEQITKLLQYLDLLYQWNKTHNLCSRSSYQQMLSYHVLDSLSVVSGANCKSKKILDVGSGAGLPGIPVSIAEPSCSMVLLECKRKKIAFLRHVVHALYLKNTIAELSRVEHYLKVDYGSLANDHDNLNGKKQDLLFDLIISRACVADLTTFVKLTERLLAKKGMLVAMKSDPDGFTIGRVVYESYKIIDLKEFNIPGIKAKRCLVFISI